MNVSRGSLTLSLALVLGVNMPVLAGTSLCQPLMSSFENVKLCCNTQPNTEGGSIAWFPATPTLEGNPGVWDVWMCDVDTHGVGCVRFQSNGVNVFYDKAKQDFSFGYSTSEDFIMAKFQNESGIIAASGKYTGSTDGKTMQVDCFWP